MSKAKASNSRERKRTSRDTKCRRRKIRRLAKLVRDYQTLVENQRTIDQYLEYNRFWQRSIASDKARFDRLTALYDLMKSGSPDAAAAISETLGKPDAPSFIKVDRREKDRIILRVSVYTDIDDHVFLEKAKRAIEDAWQATDGDTAYAVKVELRKARWICIGHGDAPKRGDHIDLTAHPRGFPKTAPY